MRVSTETERSDLLQTSEERIVTSEYGSIVPSTSADNDCTDDEISVYTELLSGSVPCPTCRGLGNVPKEQEGQLVALIPMKDKRLKPRRTYIWVCLTVFVCLLAAGLVIFFMFPRNVNITSNKPYLDPVGPVYVNISESKVSFLLTNKFNISNDNYFFIKITSVAMTVLYDTQVLSRVSNKSSLEVPMRGEREYRVDINITLDKENQMGYMASSCSNPIRWVHEMVMLFQFTCNYEVLNHSEQTTLQTFQFVSCYSSVKPSTIAPPITTHKPPKTTTQPPETTTQPPNTLRTKSTVNKLTLPRV